MNIPETVSFCVAESRIASNIPTYNCTLVTQTKRCLCTLFARYKPSESSTPVAPSRTEIQALSCVLGILTSYEGEVRVGVFAKSIGTGRYMSVIEGESETPESVQINVEFSLSCSGKRVLREDEFSCCTTKLPSTPPSANTGKETLLSATAH